MKKILIIAAAAIAVLVLFTFPATSTWVFNKNGKMKFLAACMISTYFESTVWLNEQFEDAVSIALMTPEEYACIIETLRNRGEMSPVKVYYAAQSHLSNRGDYKARPDLQAYFYQKAAEGGYSPEALQKTK